MSEVVETCWGPREISDRPYWHLANKDWNYDALFKNNVRAGKGALLSVSAGIEAEPEIENAQTPYSFRNMGNEKEQLFERIREANYPDLPPRLKSLYVFDDYVLVERALNEWFPNEEKIVHECRVLASANLHKADTTWLNSYPQQWVQAAKQYWSGNTTSSYFPETLVHGALYFPDWVDWENA